MKPIIRCSSIDRILNCAHSTYLPQEEYSNEYADEGRRQHKLAEWHLKSRSNECCAEMNANTRLYVTQIRYLIGDKIPKIMVSVEKKSQRDYGDYILQGTPDCWFILDETLHVFDLKNGETVLVEPNCLQLLGYALLICTTPKSFSIGEQPFEIHAIKTHVVQNCEVKSYDVEQCELNMLVKAIDKSLLDHTYEVGSHCGWCQSKIHCLKMRQQVDNVLTLKDGNALHETLKHKTKIEKTLKELFTTSLASNPEWFDKKGRNYKEWIDITNVPIEKKHLTPSQALKKGYDVQSNVKTVTKHHYVVKNAYK